MCWKVALDAEVTGGLRDLSRGEGATLFMTLLAVFQTLLTRYTGQADVSVGTPVAGRTRAEMEGLIGFFVNTLVLRVDASGDPMFRELLGRVKEVCIGAYAHQDVPFEKLVEELQPERQLSRSPLFQVMFALQNGPRETLALPGVTVSMVARENRSAKFDLMLTLGESDAGLQGWLEYNTDLFEAAAMKRMAQHFQLLAQSIVENPSQRASALRLLPAAEEQQVITEWNQTAVVYAQGEQCLHELFEAQVEKTPQGVALVSDAGSMSYAELNERSNQLAHYLRRRGVGAESLVGIMMERSAALVVALLGILKAGGSYLPLDPDYPRERLRFMLEDAGVEVVLSEQRLAERLPESGSLLMLVDGEGEAIAQESRANPEAVVSGENLAYVLYTSGSTGQPKGAMLAHREVVNCVLWMQQTYQLEVADRMLCKTTLNFDPSVWEVFWPLMVGARIVVGARGAQLDSAALLQTIIAEQVTVAYFVPSLLRMFLSEVEVGKATSLRYVICGGESLGVELVKRFYELLPQATLHHSYGPTETAIASAETICARESGHSVMPIGRPLANTQLYVLDGRLQPVPVGVQGELFIGGSGLGRGYLKRPELTAERFIPNHFSQVAGARLYRTGDLVRYLGDGNLQFQGRRDAQVKVRGLRIELGEIEAALRGHEKVQSTVVVAREDEGGEKSLVGYVVAVAGAEVTAAELRQAVGQQLPSYMVPAAFVMLAELPLLPNGKVDRRVLPEPERSGDGYVAPRTPAEEMLAEIFADVLRVERVGVSENFFELGGHSLLATRVVSRVRTVFGVEVALRALFEQPTVAGLSEEVERLLRAGDATEVPPLVRREPGVAATLSFAQQRLWFLDQFEPGSSAYNMPFALRLKGALDVEAFERALTEVIRRHEVLRTRFATEGDEPVQIVDEPTPFLLRVIEVDEEQRVEELVQEEASLPFDLQVGPLVRAQLLKLGEAEHVLLFTMHHIVSDGWSIGVLMREVGALYNAYARGEESPLEELPVQYADYAVWQREWLQGEALERQVEYWREQLADAPVLELPADKVRPAVKSSRGAVVDFAIDLEVSRSLREVSRSEGATLFMTLLAAFNVLLSRYTAQEDVSVGTPIAGRTSAEVEGLVGFFINTLVLRTDTSGDPTFRELVGRVREVTLGAYAHQEVPFEKLVEELQPEREMSRTPLFQVMLVLNTWSGQGLRLAGVEVEGLGVASQTAKFDLSLSLSETEAGLSGSLEYDADLFEAATIERMLEHFCVLLGGIADAPDTSLSRLPLLTDEERLQVLSSRGPAFAEVDQAECLHRLFEAQAARTPNATALTFEDEQLTYEELNRRTDRVARRLRALGVGPETLVGVLSERSTGMVVAILGVLKAGSAYLPLDPSYPAERLRFMIADSGARVMLVGDGTGEALAAVDGCAAHTLEIESLCEGEAVDEEMALEAGAVTGNLAYVIYTSGSTGRPKGVMIEHSAIVNHMKWMLGEFPLGESDGVLQKTPFSFDASVWEFYAPLLAGARLVMARAGGHQDSTYLSRLIADGGVTVLQVVPTLLGMLLDDEPEFAACTGLRRLFCGGEPLSPTVVARFRRLLDCELINLYGPTEATIDATFWRCGAAEEIGPVPIGRPVANTAAFVLDKHLQPVPVGVAGELYLGGAGLARGYLGRPALTAERFIPDPYASEPGGRLYRTGDLARFSAGGRIEYLRRADQQVKVRGFRIELGEIETALRAHAQVREVAVVVREDDPGDKRLVAYVVLGEGGAVDAGVLRAKLSESLPDYMVPSVFVMLDELPLTPNGKVDRRALPVPERSGDGYVAPRTPAEEMLAEIFADVLRVERVGVSENFFELGGHSLLATRVVSRVRTVFGVEVALRALFEQPTVAGLSEEVERLLRAGDATEVPPLVRREPGVAATLSFAQQRLWFLDQFEPGSSAYNMPFALRLKGALDVEAFERALTEVIRRHEVLRTRFATEGDEPVQIVDEPTPFLLRVIEVDEEQRVEELVQEEASLPFDLQAGPLVRAQLLKLGEAEYVLLFTMHHIISDGWSMGVLMREVGALYDAYARGEESPLEELPVQYADYAVWQREWLQGEALERQVEYWRRQLADAPVLELPTDWPRPAVQRYEGATVNFALDAEVTRGLRDLSRGEGATLFMTLLAVFQTLLTRYTGQSDISVGTPVAGRTRAETEDLIGFFVNTLVLRVNASGDLTFRELLQRVREVCFEAYAHQDVPFERVVEELRPDRELSRSPLFQAMFMLQHAAPNTAVLGDLSVEPLETTSVNAKFDVTFALGESEDGLRGTLEYSSHLFDAATMERFGEHFQRLAEAVAATPEEKISALSMLAPAERHQLLEEFNDTRRDYPRDLTLAKMFEAQAARTPDATALVAGDEQLSYTELNARAEQLAQQLRKLGVGPESLVGLCAERNTRLITGLLAVLKAGGAYVPLDPNYPAQRLAYMLEDSAAGVLLTEHHLETRLPEHEATVVYLDHDLRSENAPAPAPAQRPLAQNLAYVIYTSGSTGRPKGVAITHGSAATLVHWSHEFFSVEELASVLCSTSICFDLSIFELFVPLTCGGRVVLAANALQLPDDEEVTLINTVPSAMAELLRLRAVPDSVRAVNLAGEALRRTLVEDIYAEAPQVARVLNLYGPTEDTTYSTWREVARGLTRDPEIGRGIANTRAYVLDSNLQPVPIGVRGELYLAGEGLARGYVNRPAITAERFMPDPFSAFAGARMYRTGDVVRFLANGELEYFGRADHQVKVRGFRIELGEVESALGAEAGVRESVVLVREDARGEQLLVAYVVGEPAAPLRPTELRASLRERLPDYMIPSTFVMLDELPLTPNGKVDRRALPAPTLDEVARSIVAPRTPTEEMLAQIFEDVLQVSNVGVGENFFELGGHSLLATRVVSRVRTVFRVEMALRALFEQPTVAGLSEEVERLLRAGDATEVPPLVRREPGVAATLSFAQQRLWFLDQFEPGSSAYNIPFALRLKGTLDVAAFERALTEVIRRHEVLRTTFRIVDEQPVQLVDEPAHFALQVMEVEDEQRVEELMQEEASRPFDLEVGPLVRARVLRLGEQEHVLLFTMHHIISDGWSMGVLMREVGALYEAYARGEESTLEELPVQYADYAVWQREWLQGEALERQLEYWRRQLADAPVLELPTDRPRPAVQRYEGATISFALDAEVTGGLRDLSRGEGATLFMTLLAVFQTLLTRYTGQADVSVGTPVAGRTRAEMEGLIGFFVNTLVLRVDASGDPTFRELLGRVKEVCIGAYAHQDVPFEKLVEELQPERQLSRSPLFQVMFALQNGPRETLALPGVTVSMVARENRSAKFDLMLTLGESDAGLQGWLEYNTDLFEAAAMKRMAQHFQLLAQSIVENPSQRASALRLLPAAEEQQVITEWNQTAVVYAQGEQCLHELFEAQVEKTPQGVALVSDAGSMSYAELNERSNQLAHYLRRRGVGAESLVGIMMERSAALVVALLGILKAGGSYLPLDPDYPRERLRFMLEDAGVEVVLSEQRLAERLPESGSLLMLVDGEGEAIAQESRANPEAVVSGENLAYVLYTSGSTGQPKGAMLAHREVVNCVLWMQQTYQLEVADRMLCKTTLNFDPSVWEVFWPLMVGARIVVGARGAQLDSAALLQTIIAEQVTVAYFVPSLLRMFLSEVEVGKATSLRYVICGGESLGVELVKRFYELLPQATLHHSYGPTETAIASAETICARESGHSVMPIGRPLANTQLYVLDGRLQPVPVGVQGELFIGGSGLGRGYLKRPELTAERFIPNHFSQVAGARLYRTGDLVRYLGDGNLQFQGRRDAQVKVRGLRIELGEIEAALRGHEKVQSTVVVAREDEGGEKSLVGYVVAVAGAEVTAAELRQAVGQQLPSYMVPAAFVMLAELPLLPNGKVDRRVLPEPERSGDGYVAPRTPAEEMLAEIFADVLRVERVGVSENFFELGGHSLLATRVVSRVRTVFGVEVALRALFEQPTVAGLSEEVERLLRAGDATEVPPLVRREPGVAATLSFAQQRLWFLDQFEPGSSAYNMPFALRLKGALDVEAFERALTEVIRRHEVLRTRFATEGDEPVQIVDEPTPFLLRVIEVDEEQRVEELVQEEASLPFDLQVGPLVRAQLLKLGEAEHVLLFTMHHIVSDGWSIGVLMREVGALYNAYARGEESPLEELPVQYADYAVWQREWLQGEALDRQVEYWREQLADAPVLELPSDRPRPAVLSPQSAHADVRLSAEAVAGLRDLGRQEGCTLFMTLLAAFKVVLWRYTSQSDIVVGTPVANRRQQGTEELLGFFVNTLALRTELSRGLTFRELLARVRETCLGAYAHQDVPFEKLVEELDVKRELNRHPLVDVMMALQIAGEGGLSLEGLEVNGENWGGAGALSAKFDVTLGLVQERTGIVSGQLEYRAFPAQWDPKLGIHVT